MQEYFRQAIRVVQHSGAPHCHLRYQNDGGYDEWRVCDKDAPFQSDLTK